MLVLLTIYKFILKFFYFFIKLFSKTKNQILFLSRQSNEESIDFIYLINYLNKNYPDYKIKVLCKRMEKNNLKQIINYIFHPFVQMHYLAKSKYCFTDGYQISISCLNHKNDLKIIQIWHSLGAIKKFGYASLITNKEKNVAKIMCMHKNYDFIVSGSSNMTKYFMECFGYSNKNIFIESGLPRIDYLIDNDKLNKKKVYEIYPELKKKNIVLYVPTFRKSNDYRFDEIIEKFKNTKYQLIIKKHPRCKNIINDEYTFDKVTSLELLSVSKFIITDYSAISIEASILNKPIFIYNYDEDDYRKLEGLNINLEKELPGYVFNNIDDLIKILNKEYDYKVLESFRKKYAKNIDGTCSKKIIEKVMGDKHEKN